MELRDGLLQRIVHPLGPIVHFPQAIIERMALPGDRLFVSRLAQLEDSPLAIKDLLGVVLVSSVIKIGYAGELLDRKRGPRNHELAGPALPPPERVRRALQPPAKSLFLAAPDDRVDEHIEAVRAGLEPACISRELLDLGWILDIAGLVQRAGTLRHGKQRLLGAPREGDLFGKGGTHGRREAIDRDNPENGRAERQRRHREHDQHEPGLNALASGEHG